MLEQTTYKRLRNIYAERTQSVVFVVGSGPSTAVGLPSWAGLRKLLERELESKGAAQGAIGKKIVEEQLAGIRGTKDPWEQFDRLHVAIGEAAYAPAIREALATKDDTKLPKVFERIWQLPNVSGIVTLNLDGLVSRAFSKQRLGKTVNELNGREIATKYNLLLVNRPFVVNLHGILPDRTTWILTKTELESFVGSDAHKIFMSNLFVNRCIVFVGISVDDVAISLRLSELSQAKFDGAQRFWIKPISRSSQELDLDQWASTVGIQIIAYDPGHGHDEALDLIFNDLEQFTPQEEEAPPVLGEIKGNPLTLADPKALSLLEPDDIRKSLAQAAKEIFERNPSDLDFKEYEALCHEYRRAVHYAYNVSDTPPDNKWFDLEIEHQVGSGTFGTVYRAKTLDGETRAVKVLLERIRANAAMLGSFRRGIRSMRILSNAKIPGMVPIRDAYELPPCIIMDFIDGTTLEAVTASQVLDKWDHQLEIAISIASIIRQGHLLPDRVLHRDLRPSNVMLKNFQWSIDSPLEVIVLDFDLSWHLGAAEKSFLVQAGAALGYLAPEQLNPSAEVTTRSTAVDSFGFGMCLYFMFSGGHHPEANEAYRETWAATVHKACNAGSPPKWRSSGNRLARLILSATEITQRNRLDFGQISEELKLIRLAVRDPKRVDLAEYWIEELVHRPMEGRIYQWNEDELAARFSLAHGLEIRLSANEKEYSIHLEAHLRDTGLSERRTIDKYFSTAKDKSEAALRKAKWKIEEFRATGPRQMKVSAKISIEEVKKNIDAIVESVRTIMWNMKFE